MVWIGAAGEEKWETYCASLASEDEVRMMERPEARASLMAQVETPPVPEVGVSVVGWLFEGRRFSNLM